MSNKKEMLLRVLEKMGYKPEIDPRLYFEPVSE